jgi:HD-like signal output (HDOD) protein
MLANAQLPALPQSAIRLLELSQDPANGPIEFAVPIEADPGLTGQVLKFVNSSYFGFSREISSIKLAITLVGIRTIKNFALWSAVFSLMPNPKCGPFVLKSLWQDSLRRALFSRAFAKLLGIKEPEEQFAAALLQDMAVPLLAKENSKSYVELLVARNNGRVRLSHLEKAAFGWTHSEAAGMMARQWNLPEAFADMIESHHEVEKHAANYKSNPGKTAVAISALLPTVIDPKWCECDQFEKYYEMTVPSGSPTVAETLTQIDEQFVNFAPVLKVSNPSKSLAECYQIGRAHV